MCKHIIKPLIAIFGLYWQSSLMGCNICGASYSGVNQSVGMLQSLNRNLLIGSFSCNRFQPYNNSPLSLNSFQFNYTQLVNSRIQLSYLLPYRVNQLNDHNYTGVGDITAGLNFRWLDTRDSLFSWIKQFSMIQASITLPTGKYQIRDESKSRLPLLIQPGTGSFGYQLGLIYSVKIQRWGLLGMYRHAYFAQNELGYQLAQKQSIQFSCFRVFSRNKWALMPQILISSDWNGTDYSFQNPVKNTDSRQIYSGLQLEASLRQLYVNLGYQRVIQQTQYEGSSLYKDKLLFSAGFLF